jgi:polysaccharide pyruvyl transferase WcaK-like protein
MARTDRRRNRTGEHVRVGLFGRCGAGNIGNDASLEAVVNYLKAEHPDVRIDAMCTGPAFVTALCGIDAAPLQRRGRIGSRGGLPEAGRKVVDLAIDLGRTARWAARHDVVIIPGAGVLETSLPVLRSFPWAMLVMCVAGRIGRVKIALVSVGAGSVNQRLTRWVYDSVVRLSTYRSYRDAGAREALERRGHDVSDDHVRPDLAFALPSLAIVPGDPNIVGLGLMAFSGTNDERRQADAIHASYLTETKRFVRWLVDEGRNVRLFIGDTNGSDDGVVQEILADLRAHRPDLDPTRVVPEALSSFSDLMRAMVPVGAVVAIRYHNVLCALKLCKPTISIGYSPKHHALMADMGVDEFCEPVASLDASRLADRLTDLENRAAEVRQILIERNAEKACQVGDLLTDLSALLPPRLATDGDRFATLRYS